MKKILLFSIVATSLFACSQKSENTSANNFPADASGYTLDNSANIELSKKSAKCIETGDTATYRATYSKDAVIHENGVDETVDQNMAAISAIKAAGVTIKIDTGAIYFETKYFTPKTGHTDYVHSYMVMTLSKGSKQAKLYMHAVDAIKDGLQVEEWLMYDTKSVPDLLK
jgi:hypothetical protein